MTGDVAEGWQAARALADAGPAWAWQPSWEGAHLAGAGAGAGEGGRGGGGGGDSGWVGRQGCNCLGTERRLP